MRLNSDQLSRRVGVRVALQTKIPADTFVPRKININCFYQACFRRTREKIALEKISIPSRKQIFIRFSVFIRIETRSVVGANFFRERLTSEKL